MSEKINSANFIKMYDQVYKPDRISDQQLESNLTGLIRE